MIEKDWSMVFDEIWDGIMIRKMWREVETRVRDWKLLCFEEWLLLERIFNEYVIRNRFVKRKNRSESSIIFEFQKFNRKILLVSIFVLAACSLEQSVYQTFLTDYFEIFTESLIVIAIVIWIPVQRLQTRRLKLIPRKQGCNKGSPP